jgi:hypothetical protein
MWRHAKNRREKLQDAKPGFGGSRAAVFKMRVTFIVLAAVLIGIGSVVVLVGVIGVLDPVGTKAADDSDPFGAPGPRWHGAVITGFGVVLMSGGVFLVVKIANRRGAE